MSKISLNSIGSRYGSVDALNANFDAIEEALQNTVSRDGSLPNDMEAALDMNSNAILNASTIYASAIVIGGQTIEPGDAVAAATMQVFEFTASAGQTSYSVSPLEPTTSAVLMTVNGLDIPTSTISITGSTLSFPALQSGDEAVVKVFTREIAGATAATDVTYNPGSNGSSRTTQQRLRDILSVKDFGAVGDGVTDDTAAFQASIDNTSSVFVPDGSYNVSVGSLTGTAYWHGADYKGADGVTPLALPGISSSYYNSPWVYEPSASVGTYATYRIDRTASYTGGTPGFASSCLRVNTNVGAGVADYVWGITSVMSNAATAGENTAAYLKNTQTSTGPSWGLVVEATSSAGSAAPLVGIEVAVSANNTTVATWPTTQRVVLDVITARPGNTGADMNADIGIRITGNANAKCTRAFTVETSCLVGIDLSRANFDVGGDAIRMGELQTINLNAAGDARRIRYSNTGAVLQYLNDAGAVLFQVNDGGDTIATTSYRVGSNKVVGARATGWTAATGTATRTTFATGSVTTAQLAERVKALIDDLVTHGLIGS